MEGWRRPSRRHKGEAGEGSVRPGWKLLCITFEWFDEHLAELFKLLRTPDFLRE